MFSSKSKRSEHVRQMENLFRSEANIFILKNLKIEAKRTRSIVWKFISKRSKHAYIQKLNIEAKQVYIKLRIQRSEANMFILKNLNIEVKRTDSLVRKFISKRSEQKVNLAKRSELVYFEISQYRSEANRFASDFVLETTKNSELSFFFKTKVFDNELAKFCHY